MVIIGFHGHCQRDLHRCGGGRYVDRRTYGKGTEDFSPTARNAASGGNSSLFTVVVKRFGAHGVWVGGVTETARRRPRTLQVFYSNFIIFRCTPYTFSEIAVHRHYRRYYTLIRAFALLNWLI